MKHHRPALVAGALLQLLPIAAGALLLSLAGCSHQPPIQHGAAVPVASAAAL